ncbi:hypothetical protein P153DRAFT_136602 [Dothidotthia symphoricarpi CBS 119687]|uniref:Uncharacterized protein n=1 Tax=Dothidotthia symphoricarpi CBS 119687 TaxID=1392245 RepID=A0A6A5ZZ65_9PLEO|nr:uncharacterized protein P153DRAFT_136602 [Dothidotthia symphoricarpi CBS 119687]KAF2124173.1 hypothetical protein P153DRAFT_136602 [Dothidotthia symphoricarpi CBS 119687]
MCWRAAGNKQPQFYKAPWIPPTHNPTLLLSSLVPGFHSDAAHQGPFPRAPTPQSPTPSRASFTATQIDRAMSTDVLFRVVAVTLLFSCQVAAFTNTVVELFSLTCNVHVLRLPLSSYCGYTDILSSCCFRLSSCRPSSCSYRRTHTFATAVRPRCCIQRFSTWYVSLYLACIQSASAGSHILRDV